MCQERKWHGILENIFKWVIMKKYQYVWDIAKMEFTKKIKNVNVYTKKQILR